VHRRLSAASQQFLGRDVTFDGYVVHDVAVADAARRQRAVVVAHPLSPASRCYERLALHLAAILGGAMRGATGPTCQSKLQPGGLVH
jgi:hypothetical protein